MEDMRVYIANLGKYNEGELVGAWFEPPIDFDEVKERIGLNDRYEEYAIHDYELPFQIEEYTPIEEVNRLCALVEDFPDYVQDNLEEIMCYYNSLDELANGVDDISVWDGCESMSDVADQMLQEGLISNETLRRYFDSTAYGRELDLEGRWVEVSGMMLELPL